MLKRILHYSLAKGHYWRTVSFDELSELYANVLIRSLANSLVGIFVPIYLYTLGYSFSTILLFLASWFALRPAYDFIASKIVGKIGPKHSLVLSTIGHILYLLFLVTLPTFSWPLWLIAQLGSFSTGLHLLAFHTDFSKVKHTEHGGKEISYVVIVDKIGGIFGPLIGGFLATVYDPRLAIAVAIILQLASLVPLFATSEPVKTKQHIVYKGFPWARHKADFLSTIPFSVEGYVSLIFWPFFLAVVVLTTNTFATIGAIVAFSTLLSLFWTKLIGSLIDESKGGLLLRTGVVLNAMLHTVRPFVGSIPAALAVNIANDPITSSYRMPYMKGVYDAADSVPGYRIAYLTFLAALDSFGKFLLCFGAYLLSLLYTPRTVFAVIFVSTAIFSLGILFERFPALRIEK